MISANKLIEEFMLLANETSSQPYAELPAVYTPLLLLAVCLGYCPLDFSGKIMLGEVGNHTFGVALGLAFYVMGELVGVLVFGWPGFPPASVRRWPFSRSERTPASCRSPSVFPRAS